MPGYGSQDSDIQKIAEDLLVRHVLPEALIDQNSEIIRSIKQIVKDEKVSLLSIPSESEQRMQQFSTYGGLMRSLADLNNEKYGAASQKVLIPSVVNMVRKFMTENKLNEDSLMGSEVLSLITSIEGTMPSRPSIQVL